MSHEARLLADTIHTLSLVGERVVDTTLYDRISLELLRLAEENDGLVEALACATGVPDATKRPRRRGSYDQGWNDACHTIVESLARGLSRMPEPLRRKLWDARQVRLPVPA